MNEFIKIPGIGTLYYDKVFFETYYPILFTVNNKNGQLFLCVCCQCNKAGCKWLLTETTPQILIAVLKNKITLRNAFLEFKGIQITILSNESGISVLEKDPNDWNSEESRALPDKDEFLEAEDGEFDEEIEHYYKLINDIYETIEVKTKLTDKPKRKDNIFNELTVNNKSGLIVDEEVLAKSEVFRQRCYLKNKYVSKAGTNRNINYRDLAWEENVDKRKYYPKTLNKKFTGGRKINKYLADAS